MWALGDRLYQPLNPPSPAVSDGRQGSAAGGLTGWCPMSLVWLTLGKRKVKEKMVDCWFEKLRLPGLFCGWKSP